MGQGGGGERGEGGGWSEVIPLQDYRDGPSEGQCPPSRCSPARRRFQSWFEVAQHVSERRSRPLTSDPATSPLGLLLLHDLLALLSPALVDGVARVVDLEGVLVVHVGILDFSGLLVKLQNVSHPKSDGVGDAEGRDQRRAAARVLNHSPPFEQGGGVVSFTFNSIDGMQNMNKTILILQKHNRFDFQTFERCSRILYFLPGSKRGHKNAIFHDVKPAVTNIMITKEYCYNLGSYFDFGNISVKTVFLQLVIWIGY